MGISEKKMQIVINNYFKQECDVNTSIREAFEKGFRIGVKKRPSVQSEIHWIPCSERLPEENKYYLVTTSGTYNDIIDIARYINGTWNKASEIIAWMPLPAPYQKGDNYVI